MKSGNYIETIAAKRQIYHGDGMWWLKMRMTLPLKKNRIYRESTTLGDCV